MKLCWINRAQRSKIFWKVLDLIKLIMNASLGVYDLDLQGCCLRVPAYASETVVGKRICRVRAIQMDDLMNLLGI